MTVFKQALANAKLLFLSLFFIILLLVGLCVYSVHGLISVPTHMTVNVPPAIPDSGLTLKANEVPTATIYSFTYYIWQSLQTWLSNGEQDYQKNLMTFSPYITDDFHNELSNEANGLDRQGLLLDHEQTTFNATQSGFTPDDVKYLGHDTWLVHLVLRSVNRIATKSGDASFATSHIVSDATTSYVFKVIKTDLAPRSNHWQLQLAGFAVPPKRVKDFQ